MNTSTSMLSESILEETIKTKYGFLKADCTLIKDTHHKLYDVRYYAGKYIFKVIEKNEKTAEEIEGEVELLNMLKKRGAIISFPVNDLEGKYIQEFEFDGRAFCGVLFTFAEGEVCLKMTNKQLIMLGRELAIFHNISSSIKLQSKFKEYTLSYLMINPIRALKPAFVDLDDEYKYLQDLNFIVIKRLAQLSLSRFDFGYVHGNLTANHMHFQGDDVLTLFNFDRAGSGFLIQDIVGIFLHFFNMMRAGTMTAEDASRSYALFFDSYNEIRALTTNEIDALPFLAAAVLVYDIYLAYQRTEKTQFQKSLKDKIQNLKAWTASPMFQ
jgi:Ser/Thr protein kinase RdoA (MazF antagonist)